eukprot:CAMPEP_0205804812 /NCGR_PEP_ID=MMETSP0205-20121125/7844_1 /ASSEMBLY_ACC=CAM_ASM_000278 /TAXON_ID=36767 /ORGANISM="Euplotes focardii, Strain TN1" /LENGTH=123 /DNA_ID=CAMNT_0053075021 /DNA_START=79 /DNA_END=450 /DNA_ORIENTATION=+
MIIDPPKRRKLGTIQSCFSIGSSLELDTREFSVPLPNNEHLKVIPIDEDSDYIEYFIYESNHSSSIRIDNEENNSQHSREVDNPFKPSTRELQSRLKAIEEAQKEEFELTPAIEKNDNLEDDN